MYYDLRDLAVIEREIRQGRPVPDTWQARAELITATRSGERRLDDSGRTLGTRPVRP